MRIPAVATVLLGLLASACSSSSAPSDSGCAPVPLHCLGACGGAAPSATCVDGTWTCPEEPGVSCAVDAGGDASSGDGGGDGSSPSDAGSDGALRSDADVPCGTTTGNAATDYCQNNNGGVPLQDGGLSSSYVCTPLPAACDGGVSCTCIQTGGCMCVDDAGAITVTCDFP